MFDKQLLITSVNTFNSINYFTKICIHNLISMIQLNIVIKSAYTSICNTRYQMHNNSVVHIINISCISYTISYKIKYSKGSKRLWGSWASDLLTYYDHIHQNKKDTGHLRMWDWFHIIHHISISTHFIQFNTLRAERWDIWLIFVSDVRLAIGYYYFRQQAKIQEMLINFHDSTWCRDPSGYGPSQWVMTLHGNAIPHWPIPHPDWSLMVLPGPDESRNNSIIYQLLKNYLEFQKHLY